MILLPSEKISYNSKKNKDEIKSIIKSNIIETHTLGLTIPANTNKPYEGIIENNGFKMRRILKMERNSFTPLIKVKIENNNDGCYVQLLLIPQIHYFLIMSAFLTLFIVMNIISLTSNSIFEWFWALPLIFSYIFGLIIFSSEASDVNSDFVTWLELEKNKLKTCNTK